MNAGALDDVVRRRDGRVDVEGMAAALRRLGRVHRFESAAGVPGGSGWTLLALAAPRDPNLVDPARFGDVMPGPRPDIDVGGDDGLTRARRLASGVVVALPYPSGQQPAHMLADPVSAAVAIREDAAFLAMRRDGADGGSVGVGDVRTVVQHASRDVPAWHPDPQQVKESAGRDRFCRDVERVLERIAAGDVYVLNLTRQLTAAWRGDVHALYRALKVRSPAPHGAVIEFARGTGLAVLSPETFLRAAGRDILTRPIKGTRPRSSDPARDKRFAEELRTSGKERAENTMVVDLERNDLGRVCAIGSVEVPELCVVEGHPTVWQLVSTVRGELREDADYRAAIAACFPCGSVTGAPKLRAMQIVDELETTPRGWYCGAAGWLCPGSMDLAVTIRTAVLSRDGVASYGTGAGIVADSDPESEYEETWAKAIAFLDAVNAIGARSRPR